MSSTTAINPGVKDHGFRHGLKQALGYDPGYRLRDQVGRGALSALSRQLTPAARPSLMEGFVNLGDIDEDFFSDETIVRKVRQVLTDDFVVGNEQVSLGQLQVFFTEQAKQLPSLEKIAQLVNIKQPFAINVQLNDLRNEEVRSDNAILEDQPSSFTISGDERESLQSFFALAHTGRSKLDPQDRSAFESAITQAIFPKAKNMQIMAKVVKLLIDFERFAFTKNDMVSIDPNMFSVDN